MSSRDLKLNISLDGGGNLDGNMKDLLAKSKALEHRIPGISKQLKELALNERLVRQFNDTRESISNLRPELDKVRARFKEAQAEVKIGKATTREFQAARTAADKVERKYRDLTQQAADMSRSLKAAGADVHNLAAFQETLAHRTNETTRAMRRAEAQQRLERMKHSRMERARTRASTYERYGQSSTRVGVGLTGIGIGTFAIGSRVTSAYAQAENASMRLKTAMMDSSGHVNQNFAKINELAERLGDKLPGTTADFQDMMTMLQRQGVTAETVLSGTGKAAAYLGVQLGLMPAQAAEFAAKMQDSLSAPAKDMMGVMDMIQKTFYVGVDSNNMMEAFSKSKSGMQSLKLTGLEGAQVMAPLIALLDQSKVEGSLAGTAISKIINRSIKFNKDAISHGLNFVRDGEHIGIKGLFGELSKLKKMDTEKRLEVIGDIFGRDNDTLTALAAMIDKGYAGYEDMSAKMARQASLQQKVDESLKTLQNVQEAAGGTWTNFMAEIGKSFAPELKAIITMFGDLTAWLRQFAADHPVLFKNISLVVGALAALITVGGVLLVAIGALAPVFVMLTLKAAAMGTTIGAIVAPVLAVVAAVGLLVTAGVLLWANWKDVVGGWKLLMENLGITDTLSRWFTTIDTTFTSIKDTIVTKFEAVTNYFKNTSWKQIGIDLISGLADGILAFAMKPVNAVLSVINDVKNAFTGKQGIDAHSPSRLFAKYGGFTTAGLAQGIYAGIPHVLQSITQLSARVRSAGAKAAAAGIIASSPALAASDASSPVSAPTATTIMNVQIRIEAGQQSPEAIAVAIRRELEKLQQAQQTAQDARMFDTY